MSKDKKYDDLPDGAAKKQKPAKCRIVLFGDGQGDEVPAIITKVIDDEKVNLTVFVSRETGTGWIDGVPFAAAGVKGPYWRWPDRT